MLINEKDIEKLSALSRIGFTGEQKERLIRDLNNMAEGVRNIDGTDTEGVAPTRHILSVRNVLREDKAAPFGRGADILKNAPCERDGYFVVPAVVEGE